MNAEDVVRLRAQYDAGCGEHTVILSGDTPQATREFLTAILTSYGALLALAEAVKPLGKISDVRIVDMGGRGGPLAAGGSNGAIPNGGGTPAESLLSALLQYRANAPIIDQLLAQAGFAGANPVDGLVSALKTPAKPVEAKKLCGS